MARRHTVASVAEGLDVDNDAARGFVRVLCKAGIVGKVGKAPMTRGMSADIYEFPDDYLDRLLIRLRAASLAD